MTIAVILQTLDQTLDTAEHYLTEDQVSRSDRVRYPAFHHR